MKIDQDSASYLQDFIQLLIVLDIIKGSVHYEVLSDIFKPSRYEVVNISIRPKTTV